MKYILILLLSLSIASHAWAAANPCMDPFFKDLKEKRLALKKHSYSKAITHNIGVTRKSDGYFVYPMMEDIFYDEDIMYFTEARANLVKIEVSEDGLILMGGKPLSTVTSNPLKENSWDIVMTGNGDIYIYEGIENKVHHSSVTHGEPLASAGMAQVQFGRLKKLTTQTRHYADPTAQFIRQVEAELRKRGADMSEMTTDYWTGDLPEAVGASLSKQLEIPGEFFND